MTSPLHRLIAAVAVLTGLAAPLAVTGAARADTETHRDPRGDVTDVSMRAPRPSADVLRLTSTHADGVVAMRVGLADLDSASLVNVGFTVVTSRGDRYIASVTRDAGQVGAVLLDTRDGGPVPCPGLRGRVLPDADRVAVSVPRVCLDRPRWVRTGAASFASAGPGSRAVTDDARRDGTTGTSTKVGTRRLFLN